MTSELPISSPYRSTPDAAVSEAESLRNEPCDSTTSIETGEPVESSAPAQPVEAIASEAPAGVHTSAELMEAITGTAVDSPLCFTCGTKMRPAGSCYVCEGCGSTSGCS